MASHRQFFSEHGFPQPAQVDRPRVAPVVSSARSRVSTLAACALFGAALALVLSPWVRNHALISDPYDYSMMSAVVGKWQQSLSPYIDYDTPMQIGTPIANFLSEKIWGPRFLSMTYGNAVFIALGLAGFYGLLRRRLDHFASLVIAASLVAATASQHSIIWHNCLAATALVVALWTASLAPRTRRGQIAASVALGAALLVSGLTKLNFHTLCLVSVAGIAWHQQQTAAITTRQSLFIFALLLLCGIVAPLALELIVSGADFPTWWHQIVSTPEARRESLRHLFTPGFYGRDPYVFYPSVHLPMPALLSMALGIATGSALLVANWRQSARSRRVLLGRLVPATTIVVFAGPLLIATNIEVAFVNLAPVLALCWTLFFLFRPAADAAERSLRWSLLGVTFAFGVLAWWCAWQGGRVLYGDATLARERLAFTPLKNLPPRFAYFEGLIVTRPFAETLRAIDREYGAASARELAQVFFTEGADWFERAFPESTARHVPAWMHQGTTYRARDGVAVYLRSLGTGKRVWVVVPNWDFWPFPVKRLLAENTTQEELAPSLRRYTLKWNNQQGEPIPVHQDGFSQAVRTNIERRFVALPAGSALWAPDHSSEQAFFGTTHDADTTLQFESQRLQGVARARLLQAPALPTVTVEFRAIAVDPHGFGEILWSETATLTSDERVTARPFRLQVGGKKLRLETRLSVPDSAAAGWSDLIITDTGIGNGSLLPIAPLNPTLKPGASIPSFVEANHEKLALTPYGDLRAADHAILARGDSELWCQLPASLGKISSQVRLLPGTERCIVRLAWYYQARFETLFFAELNTATGVTFIQATGHTPQPGGQLILQLFPSQGHDDRPQVEVRALRCLTP